MGNPQEKNTLEQMIANGADSGSDIPLEELLSQAREEASSKPVTTTPTQEVVKELSPLEKMKLEKEKDPGLIVDNEALEKGMETGPKKDIIHNDDRQDQWKESIENFDILSKKREAVYLLKSPVDMVEYIELIDEIESVIIAEDGTASFPEGSTQVYCRLREEGEEINDFESLKDTLSERVAEDGEEKEEELSEETKKVIQVIIDKTGLGSDFAFTDEEKKKLEEAEVIRVKPVKTIDINAIRAKRIDKSFQDIVNAYDYTGSKTTICFPASGFKAQMKGLTYGEYADIALSMDTVTFDQYYKRLSIIYNKMTNVSTGAFVDFEDFLQHFAYTDVNLALYALLVSTEKENRQIELRCGNRTCNKSFEWEYQTRSLLRLEKCGEKFLNSMKDIASADAADYDTIRNDAAVNNSQFIELPESGMVVEVGVASAYDFLYNFVPLLDKDTFTEAFGDVENNVHINNMLLLTTVRSVMVPVPEEDGYIECTGYKDILDAIYRISPEEIKILAAYTAKFPGAYEATFSFGDVVCPHCKTVTKNLEVDMDTLVFRTYQRLMSTEVDLEKLLDS